MPRATVPKSAERCLSEDYVTMEAGPGELCGDGDQGKTACHDSGSDTQLRPDVTRMEFDPAAILCSSRWL